jgi:hypothetical protein
MPDGIKGEDFLQNINKYGSGIVKTVTVKMPDLEEPKPLTDDECILSTTTITTPHTAEGKRTSRDEFFRRLKNEHEDRFSKLIIPSAEPVLSAEDWLKSIRKWGSSLERDETHELIIDLQEGQETDREVIVKTLRYYKLNLPFVKLFTRSSCAFKCYFCFTSTGTVYYRTFIAICNP